jgi:serine/threonine-protein kinase HipA
VKLEPGAPLAANLVFDEGRPPIPAARLAMAQGLAQLEWSAEVLSSKLPVSGLNYPPEPGLHAARRRDLDGLHGFLSDSLPDAWGTFVMRRRLARLGVRIDDLSPLDRLALVGRQGRGAMTFLPDTAPAPEVETLDLDVLAAESLAMLAGDESELATTLATLANGSGGARPKIHVGFDPGGAICVTEGEAAPGHDAWIVKFAAPNDLRDIGAIEAAYAAMAKSAGVDMAEHRLLPAKSGPGYFATRRFDRPEPGHRLHMVSLGGAIETPWAQPSSYDLFLRATLAITRHAGDVAAAFRRMVFNILAVNRDDHVRQHSYLMDAAGTWRLAPAYDLTYSAGPGGEHYLDVEGEGRRPARAQVRALGKRHGLDGAVVDAIVDEVAGAVAGWTAFADEAGVTRTSKTEVEAAHAAVSESFFTGG